MTASFVREGKSGAYEVVRGDKVASTHGTRDEALDAALAADGLKPRDMIFRGGDGALVGQVRWLDASAQERIEGHGDIDRVTLEQAAAHLNANPTPIPLDGGEGSEVHGSSETRGNVPANGWGQFGVVLERADGSPHLMLRAELFPDLAADVDSGRRAFGSVDLGYDRKATKAAGGALRGVTWDSHAITNRPLNRQLMPSTARAAAKDDERGRILASATRLTMGAKNETKTPETKPADDKAKTQRADAPPPAPPPGDKPPAAPAEGDVAALAARVAELEAQVELLLAANGAIAEAAPDPEKVAMAAVEKAISDGRVPAAAKDAALKLARANPSSFEKLTERMRAHPGASATRAGEASPRLPETKANGGKDAPLDATDPYVKSMRAAKVSDAGIRAALAKRDEKKAAAV